MTTPAMQPQPPSIRLVVVGRQGSGKGTQCELLARHFQLPHVSSGDLFRAACASGTPLGNHVAAIIEKGDLVPDDLTLRVVAERLARPDALRGWILDGFPRTVDQAVALDRLIAPMAVDAVVNIEVPAPVVLARLAERGRGDDTPEAIAKRLATYEAETVPVVDFYRSRGRVLDVNGVGEVGDVFARITMQLAEFSVTARSTLEAWPAPASFRDLRRVAAGG